MTSRFGLALEEIEFGELVGRGGSGEVFAARHRATGARLAAKIYPFDRMDPAFRPRERFQRECRILSRMEHPAFPALYGCGEEDEGTGWALMEWIEGEPLSAFRSSPVHEVVRLAYGIASALDALHVQGVLHRDIAFDNVLVERRRFGNNPRLIDLGVAKDIRSNEDLTMVGAFLGRVPFASPELLTGEGAAGLVDPRSDVFSFGVLLFEWLSGMPPFPGETPESVLKAQKKRAAPKLELRKEAGEADEALSEFVASLLEVDMEKRPDSDAVVDRLARLRRLHAPPDFEQGAPSATIYRTPSGGYALIPQRFEAAPALPRLRFVSFPEPSSQPAAGRPVSGAAAPPGLSGAPAPPAAVAPQGGGPAGGSKPGVGRLVLVLGVVAFLVACAVAAFVLFSR